MSDALAPGQVLHLSDVLASGCVRYLCLMRWPLAACYICLSDALTPGCAMFI